VTVGAVSISGPSLGLPQVPVPPGARPVLQVLLGAMVGLRMDRDALRSGLHALVPASLLAVSITAVAIASALLATTLTSVHGVTALFAAAPGGLTEMTTTSTAFDADAVGVAALQLARVLLAISIVDIFLKSRESKDEGEQEEEDEEDEEDAGSPGYLEEAKELGVAAPWAVVGGVIGLVSGVPAGGIVGALVGSAAFELITGRSVPLARFRIGVQVLAGVVIGLGVSSSLLGEIGQLALAGAVIIPVQLIFWLIASWLLVKLSGYKLSTATLASTPGGISGVIPVAEETGADAVIVTFMHLVRLSTIVVVVPLIATMLFGS
jgi:uncharacterized protein